MKLTRLARLLSAVAVVAVTVAGAAGSWACFPLPVLTLRPRASGPVGVQIVVDGVDFGEGVATEIRWNAIDGPLLGRGSKDRFSVPVTIPEADDGTYAIVALSRLIDDSVGVKAAATFQVQSGAGAPPSGVAESRASSASTKLSPVATAGLALTGGALFGAGVLAGAFLSRRRRAAPAPEPAGSERG